MNLFEIGQHFTPQHHFLFVFIITIAVLWFILVFYSIKNEGLSRTIRFFLPMMIAAMFIESSGVANGRFYYPGYLFYFAVLGGGVPLIVILGWSTNLYLFLRFSIESLTPWYTKKNFLQIGFLSAGTASIGICLDVLEDPLAHHLGWWVWVKDTSPILLFGVPLSNYIDWVIILFVMSFITLWIEYTGFSEKRKLLLSFFSLPIVFAVIIGLHLGFEMILGNFGLM